MSDYSSILRLDEHEIERLDRRLAIAASKIRPDVERGSGRGMPGAKEVDQICEEILQSCRTGVRIASQAEARPLLPLFKAAGKPLPPELKVDSEKGGYEFYFVDLRIGLVLPSEQFPLRAEVGLALVDDVDDLARRLRPIQLFPGRQDVSLFSADLEAAIGLNAAANLSIPMAPTGTLPFLKVDADAKLKAGFVLGPLRFALRRAVVEIAGEGSQELLWRYNFESRVYGAQDLRSVMVLKIAREARHAQIKAAVRVSPVKVKWLLFKDVLPDLHDQGQLAIELLTKGSRL